MNCPDDNVVPAEISAGDMEEVPPCLVLADAVPSPNVQNEICIDKKETIIGSDPAQCTISIQAEGVSTQHACLVRHASGAVTISDLGSEAGTWVNYTPISGKGLVLNEGDLVQIGSLSFRYRISRLK